MNLAGALHEAGSAPLRGFAWGETVVNIVNSALPSDKAVTLDNSGYEVKERLNALEVRQNHSIMSISLKAFESVARDPNTGGGVPLQVEKGRREDDPESTYERDNAKSTITMVIGGGIVIVAILVALSYNTVAYKTGELPDTGMLETLAKILVEILKAFYGGGESGG